MDYFTLTLPYAGVLTASTTGADTTGRLYQAQAKGEPLLVAADTDSGRGTNFRLGTAVAQGTYYLAVSAGRRSGEYRLAVHYTPALAELFRRTAAPLPAARHRLRNLNRNHLISRKRASFWVDLKETRKKVQRIFEGEVTAAPWNLTVKYSA